MQGTCFNYWSSSAVGDLGDARWYVYFGYGYVGPDYVDVGAGSVRCVR
jgi:hypothetical protein